MWSLGGPRAADFAMVNEFLAYLADRNFSPRTGRAYAYDLLAFARWLIEVDRAPGSSSIETGGPRAMLGLACHTGLRSFS